MTDYYATRPVRRGPEDESVDMRSGDGWILTRAEAVTQGLIVPREVFVIREKTLTPDYVLCGQCIDGVVDPAACRRDIVKRDDSLHCVGCDYHVGCNPKICEAYL